MDILHVDAMPYACDWDGECMAVFATLDELTAHELDHWAEAEREKREAGDDKTDER